MSMPTDKDIDDAVPIDGEPSRAKLNALLKQIVALQAGGVRFVDSVPMHANDPGEIGDIYVAGDYIYAYSKNGEWRKALTQQLKTGEE